MKLIIPIIIATLVLTACEQKKNKSYTLVKADTAMLDSIRKNSDSTYTKKYKRTDFVTADYFISNKDSAVTQVMRDSANTVRQVIISRKNVRSYFAQYYASGQLQADLKLDSYGQYEGPAIYYYENGAVKSKGNYHNGLANGEWKEYSEKGDSSMVKYNTYGNRIN